VFDTARSIAIYDGSLKEAIHKFKFKCKTALGEPLAGVLIEYLARNPVFDLSRVDVLTTVPLHLKRERERGFNQSEFIAKALATYFDIPFRRDLIAKTRDTKPQFGLCREERFGNVAGAFEVKSLGNVIGRNVLIIDDIFTTGATASECARVLKEYGALSVHVLTLSRAVDD
jgi:ComF family protein